MAFDVIVVVHDIASAQRLIDFAKLVYGLGFRQLVATKVYGAAASSAVPEVTRLAIKLGRAFHVLATARDAVEVFQPTRVVTVTRDGGEPVDPWSYAEKLEGGKVMIILSGVDAGLGKDAAALGEPVYPAGTEDKLSPIAEAAILLYPLARRRASQA
ncbi:MAG: RecB-family nuclease [Thermoproteota archaeon]